MAVTIRRLYYRGTGGSGGATDASNVAYDNAGSGLAATNVQDAIDELAADTDTGAISQTFNNASWIGPVGGAYSIIVPFATHGKANPTISLFELVSLDYLEVEASVTVAPSNDITINVPSSPDLRFTGKITII